MIERSATIPWPFELEDADEWLDFLPVGELHWKLYTNLEDLEEIEKEAGELTDAGKREQAFYHVSRMKVTIDTFERVKTQFIGYAMPKAAKLLKKIIQVVSSSSFQAAMDRLKGGSSRGSKRKS